MVLQVSESGELVLPAELVQSPPHTNLEAERHGEALVVKPITTMPSVRENGFTFPNLAGRLAGETGTFRRDDIYGSEGR